MRVRIHTGKFREEAAFLQASLGEIPRNLWFTPLPKGPVAEEGGLLLHAQVNGAGVKRRIATRLESAEPLDVPDGLQAYPVHYADLSRIDPCMGWATLTLFKPGAQLEYEIEGEDTVKLGAIVEHKSPYPFPDMMRHQVKADGRSDIKNLQYFMALFEILGMNVEPRMRYFSGAIHFYARDENRMILANLAVEDSTGGMWDSNVPVAVLERLKTSKVPIKFNFERPGKLEITCGDDLYFVQESSEYNPGFDYQGVARQICDFERCVTIEKAVREYIENMEAAQVVLIKVEPGTMTVVPIAQNPEEPAGNYQVSGGVSQLSCGYTKAPFVSVIKAEHLGAFSAETPIALWGTPSPASPFLVSNGMAYLASYVFVTPSSLAGLLGDGMEVEKKALIGYSGDPNDVYQEVFRGPEEESTAIAHPTAPDSQEVAGRASLYLAEVPGRRFKYAGGVSREALGMHMHEFSVQRTFSRDVVDRFYIERVWPELDIFVWYDDVWTPWQHFRDPEGQEETDGADIPKKHQAPPEGAARPARAAAAPAAPEVPEEKDSESSEIALDKSVENPINNIGGSTVSAPEAPVPPKEEPVAYLLVDGHYVTWRDFYVKALMEMRGPGGIRAGLVFSFLRELRKLIRIFNPARVIVVWDHESAAWRRELLPEYRVRDHSKIPAEELKALYDQRAELQANLNLVGVRSIHLEGQEADDLIALIASSVQGRTIIATNDSDFEQLVDGRVQVYKMKKGHLLELPTEAEELVAAKAIVGESSDNIPGVPGCGEKSMAKFIEEIKEAGAKVTFDEIKSRAAGHKNYRIKKIVQSKDGGDPWQVVERNRQIIDLTVGMRKIPPEVMVQALSVVSQPAGMEPIAFGEWVKRLGAQSILKEMSDWQRSFGTLA